jgi:hypothetical protein
MREPGLGLRAILTGGLVAGSLDLVAALVVYGLRGAAALAVLQSIASGALGRAAFGGGARTAALGVVFHFLIATVAAAVYCAASRRLPVLTARPIACGAAYGVAVWIVMNLVVVPLSAIGWRPIDPPLAAVIILVHVACVGVPIALVMRRASRSAITAVRREVRHPPGE